MRCFSQEQNIKLLAKDGRLLRVTKKEDSFLITENVPIKYILKFWRVEPRIGEFMAVSTVDTWKYSQWCHSHGVLTGSK
jgi:hypothetical protein